MRQALALTLLLCAGSLLLAACSEVGDPVAANDPSVYDKQHPILPPPPWPDPFLVSLQETFDELTWIEVSFEVNTSTGGTFTLLPAGYPSGYPVIVNIEGNPAAGGSLQQCKIFVAAGPPAGGYLDIPGDCILYKTENFPPEEAPNATIDLPVMRWYRSSSYTGSFATYRIGLDENAFPVRQFVDNVSLPSWPPIVPNEVVYVTVPGDPGVNEGGGAAELVAEPTEEPELP